MKKYQIDGMACSACASAVERILNRLDEIDDAQVNLTLQQVNIQFNQELSIDKMNEKLNPAGFTISEIKEISHVQLHIDGMSCASCSSACERILNRIHGVEATVNLLNESADITYDKKQVRLSEILEVIKKAGFTGSVQTKTNEIKQTNKRPWDIMMVLILGMVLLYIGMSHMLGNVELPLPKLIHYKQNPVNFAGIQWILATAILIIGRNFYIHGIRSFMYKVPNMDTLVAIGTGSAYIYSTYSFWQVLQGNTHYVHSLYFESAGVVVALVMLGKYLEKRSKEKTVESVSTLVKLRPDKAILWKDEKEIEILTEEIMIHDILVVKAGDRIPQDGIIVEGFSTIDESMLTGESMPVDKNIGDTVIGGTINLNGKILVQVTKDEKENMLSKIIQMVEDAQSQKAPIARIADKVSGIFVPVVMMIAIVAALLWWLNGYDIDFVLTIFVSVLVIACPCALGLATPTAIMVGTGTAAKNGIFIKSGEALESLSKIDTVVFDKTGTLTIGHPVVNEVYSIIERVQLFSIIQAIESGSKHPISKALLEKTNEFVSEDNYEKAYDIKTLNGLGMIGNIKEKTYLIGSKQLMYNNEIEISLFNRESEKMFSNGQTVIYVAQDKKIIACIGISDELKPNASKVIQELKEQKIDVVMLSGDNERSAHAIAKKVGIEHVVAQVLPMEKGMVVKNKIAENKYVAFVGDGINDAVALSEAHVGVAIGSGSDVAIDSAEIVLVKDNLEDVLLAIRLSKAVIRNIKQNLFWAFFYNSLGIPVAAGLLYLFHGPLLNPVFAGAAMAFSSVSVVSNALRLRKFK